MFIKKYCVYIKKDILRRYKFYHFEKKRLILKYLSVNTKIKSGLTGSKRNLIFSLLYRNGQKSSITYIRKRCIITGRGQGILKHFKLSRMKFKELNSEGYLTKITKANSLLYKKNKKNG